MQISLKFGLSTNLFTIPINLYYCFFYSVPETVIHQPQLNQPKHTAVNIPDDLRHWLDSNQFNSTVRLLGHYNNKKYRSTLLPSAFSCHQSKLRPLYLKKKKKDHDICSWGKEGIWVLESPREAIYRSKNFSLKCV